MNRRLKKNFSGYGIQDSRKKNSARLTRWIFLLRRQNTGVSAGNLESEGSPRLKIKIFDQNSKFAPNDPQMVWDEFGGVFLWFSAFFGWFRVPFIVKNAYSGHFERPISRDLGGFWRKIEIWPKRPPDGVGWVWWRISGIFGLFFVV